MERFRALYGSTKCASLGLNADDLEVILKNKRASAEGIRRRLKARMGDVSVFMREVKTRFTFWYNEKHGMVGTFWAERFRSVVVEADTEAQRMVWKAMRPKKPSTSLEDPRPFSEGRVRWTRCVGWRASVRRMDGWAIQSGSRKKRLKRLRRGRGG